MSDEAQYFEQFVGDETPETGTWWVVSSSFAKSWHKTQQEAVAMAEQHLADYHDLEVIYIPPGHYIGMRVFPFVDF